MTDYAALLQASTLKQRLGMQKFGSFTAKKSAKRSSGTLTACILCFFIFSFSSGVHMSSRDMWNTQVARMVPQYTACD